MSTIRRLTQDDWSLIETLFGPDGASDGCWCMSLRTPVDADWEEIRGDCARRRFRRRVTSGRVFGVLACDGETPTGWCSYGPRSDFPALDGPEWLRIDDADRVWSIGCFFIAPSHRGQGLPRRLLSEAIDAMRELDVSTAEAYPVDPDADEETLRDWNFTGAARLFEAAEFELVDDTEGPLNRYRLDL